MKIGSLVKNKFSIPLFKYILLLFIISLIISCNTSELSEVFLLDGNTMGTTYTVKIVSDQKNLNGNVQYKIDSLLASVNQSMSTYIDDSEISKFNNYKDTTWYSVSNEFAYVLSEAKKISEATDYYYDVTIGPVVNLWGFGPTNQSAEIPTSGEIEKAKNNTGIAKLIIDLDNNKIKKTTGDLYLDLSSIAKGFGVDKVGELVEDLGYTNYMIEIGGEVRTRGINDKNEPWKIGISTPLGNSLQKVVAISNLSIATSGDYLNYFEENGVRYSHLINPKTGKPITHNLASVSVIAEECSYADALATAIDVMGPTLGFNFALEKKLPIFMIVRENNSFVEKMTPQFEEFIIERK
jgi:thiamine biosynthesis lipoprotein